MLKTFQSDCDVINHRLKSTYTFDVMENVYTFYLPNLLQNNGHVEKYQVVYTDYKFNRKIYKPKESNKK